MVMCRVLSRVPKSAVARRRNPVVICSRPLQHLAVPSNNFHSLRLSSEKFIGSQGSLPCHGVVGTSILQRFGISSSASPQSSEKVEGGNTVEDENSEHPDQSKESASGDSETGSDSKSKSSRRSSAPKVSSSDSETDDELSRDDLVRLVEENEELLKSKQEEIVQLKDKVLRTYAEMENVMNRTKREAENSKKFAIQSFAKGLLDVADTLERASSVVKESFAKIDVTKDDAGAVPLLKTLLEGVQMTDKQLAEAFRKFGVEKFDPANEQFDPHRHNAVFQVPDKSKSPGSVATVLKCGYLLHDRVIRPAEVGVTTNGEEAG